MTTPPQPPEPNRPHASCGVKVRDGKRLFDAAGVGRGLGDAPNSRMKKIAMWIVVAMIVLFIVMDFVDRSNAKNASRARALERAQPTIAIEPTTAVSK